MNNITLYRFADEELLLTVTEIPPTQTLQKGYLAIKKQAKDSDSIALILKEITGTLSADGQIIDDGTDGTGQLKFLFGDQEFASIIAGVYWWGTKVKLLNNDVHVVPDLIGRVTVKDIGVENVA